MKRIFIAVRIEPQEKLLRMITSFRQVLKNDAVKWTETSNIHITLVFLGDTEEKRVNEIDDLLKKICSGFGDFELVLSGAGVFRNIRDPRVIWTGIADSVRMSELNNIISAKLIDTGSKLETRPFSPHLTLGRVKRLNNISDLTELVEKYRDKEIQRVKVTEVILYESILRPEGPVYKPLGRYSLS
jgi:2'-5' RNA ligase